MGSMYGNITQHIPRTNFKFAAVYPSRLAMALDEKDYWNHFYHSEKDDYEEKNGAIPIHNIKENDYVLVNYTVPKKDFNSDLPAEIFSSNQADDINNINRFAYEVIEQDDGTVVLKLENGQPIMQSGRDSDGNYLYNEYYADLIDNGGTFAPGDYHMTVWQKQRVRAGADKPTYVAICRLHSILPTFETWGSYHIDILDPLSSYPDAFGAGKEWWYPQKPSEPSEPSSN